MDRLTGTAYWSQPRVGRLLAVTRRFVVALDPENRLLVVDRRRGLVLGTWDGARAFRVPVTNDVSDRVYLGNHDGLVLALRDMDAAAGQPLAHAAVPPAAPPKPAAPPAEADAPAAPEPGAKPAPPADPAPMKPGG